MAGRGPIDINHKQRRHIEPYLSPSPRTTNIYENGMFRTVINGHEILSFDVNNKWTPATDPLHYDKPDKCGIGPGLSFAKLIAELDIIDNKRKIGLIPCAVGGTSIKQWLPKHIKIDKDTFIELKEDELSNNEGGIFERTLHKTQIALRTPFNQKQTTKKRKIHKNGSMNHTIFDDYDGLDITLKAILWHQGESDCDTQNNANNYLSAALLLLESFRKYFNNDNIPILVGGLADFLGRNANDNFIYYNIINTALKSLPERVHNIAFVATNDLNHKGDWLHFDSASCRVLGQRYAAKYALVSGSLTTAELDKYMRFNRFKNVLKRHGSTAYQKTKDISFTIWFLGIVVTVASIYSYKRFYAPNEKDKN
eukprot:179609_1